MSLVSTVVNRPITIVILCISVVILALSVLPFMPQDVAPDIETPVLSVTTRYKNASPSEIETTITKPLESVLSNIKGLTNIQSFSYKGFSQISLEFDWGTNLETAVNDIRDQLDRVRYGLPDESDAPVIYKSNLNATIPVSAWNISGNGLGADELYKIAKNDIKPYLERVLGVSEVDLSGGREERVNIKLFQNRLQAYSITIGEVGRILKGENLEIGGGNIEEKNRTIALHLDGKFKTIEDIENIVVKTIPTKNNQAVVSVRLRDLGEVSLDFETAKTISYLNGEKSLSINVFKRSGSNTMQVSRGINKEIKNLQKKLPRGIKFAKIFDSAIMISNSLTQVVSSTISGAILTIMVLVIFLRSPRSALIIAITMPLSILATLVMMYFSKLRLNVVSLAGLNLGIGMIVDSSIVLLENATRYREKGIMARSSAILGCQEMTGAIVAGSLTTICVFLPMVLFRKELGIVGALVKDMAFTVVISLATSLVFALVTVPVLGGVLLPINTPTQKPLSNKIMQIIDIKLVTILNYLDNKYAKGIQWALEHKKIIISSILLSLAISAMIFIKFIAFQLIPANQDDTVQLSYNFPQGTSLEFNTKTINNAVKNIKNIAKKGIKYTVVNAGFSGVSGSNNATGRIFLITPQKFKDRSLSNEQIMKITREVLSKIPGLMLNFESRGPSGSSGGPALVLQISSRDQALLDKTADKILAVLRTVKSLRDVQTDAKKSQPEIQIVVNRDKAWEYGLSFTNIAQELRNNFGGSSAGTFEYDGHSLDIWITLRKEDRQNTLDLEKIFFLSNKGVQIPLASIASLENSYSRPVIIRNNQRREVMIFAMAAVDKNGKRIAASIVNADARKAIRNNIILPENVTLETGGSQKDFLELLPKIGLVLFLAGFLVYAVMAAQFENLKDPGIIFMSILTIPIGPSIFYLTTRSFVSAYSMIGFIILIGIVVNHGIVLIDYTNLLRKRKMPLYDAVILAGRHRLRPIMMTTLTTVLGMIPMAIAKGDGTEMSRPIGQAVVAGMISSSILTLFFTPVLYYTYNLKNEKKRILQEQEKRLQLEAKLEKVKNLL